MDAALIAVFDGLVDRISALEVTVDRLQRWAVDTDVSGELSGVHMLPGRVHVHSENPAPCSAFAAVCDLNLPETSVLPPDHVNADPGTEAGHALLRDNAAAAGLCRAGLLSWNTPPPTVTVWGWGEPEPAPAHARRVFHLLSICGLGRPARLDVFPFPDHASADRLLSKLRAVDLPSTVRNRSTPGHWLPAPVAGHWLPAPVAGHWLPAPVAGHWPPCRAEQAYQRHVRRLLPDGHRLFDHAAAALREQVQAGLR